MRNCHSDGELANLTDDSFPKTEALTVVPSKLDPHYYRLTPDEDAEGGRVYGLVFTCTEHRVKQDSTNPAGSSSSLRMFAWLVFVYLLVSALRCFHRTPHLGGKKTTTNTHQQSSHRITL